MRGHGRSDEVAPYNWASFGRDLQAFATALDIRQAIGVGHSMGGHCVTQLAGERTGCFRELLLLDPVIFEPEVYATNSDQGFATAAEHPVARRREHWDSWQDMQASLAGKGTFGLWDPQVFEDYCRYGVLPVLDGDGVRLACRALVEASVYMGSSETDVHQLIPNIRIPVTVLRAPPRDPGSVELDFSKSPTVPDLASRFVQAQDVLLVELTHFIPMQAPELVAEYITRALVQ
jgi:lipase